MVKDTIITDNINAIINDVAIVQIIIGNDCTPV